MDWTKNYQLFLFDFDGLLVNTEALHLESYQRMCLERGHVLDLDLATYNRVAQFDATGPSKAIYAKFPELKKIDWEVLRGRKNQIYLELVQKGEIELMPGVEPLLLLLQQKNIPHCVVTHSKPEQIAPLRRKFPLLDQIPHWITRQDYSQPKPHPECYLKAIKMLAKPGDQIIGFEDSPKGLQALLAAGCNAVMVNPFFTKEEILKLTGSDFFHFTTLVDLQGIDDLKKKKSLSSGA